jgi:hypothetical protein
MQAFGFGSGSGGSGCFSKDPEQAGIGFTCIVKDPDQAGFGFTCKNSLIRRPGCMSNFLLCSRIKRRAQKTSESVLTELSSFKG